MTVKDEAIIREADEAVLVAAAGPQDRLGTFIAADEQACLILGYTRQELARLSPFDLFAPEEADKAAGLKAELLKKGRGVFEIELVAKDGRRIPAEHRVHFIDLPERTVVLCVLRDVTASRRAEADLMEAHRDLEDKRRLLEEEIRGVAVIQQSLLPQSPPRMEGVEIEWRFRPSHLVGGDIFNVFRLDEHSLGLYMLDVSGHGIPSAMVTVSVSQMLQPQLGALLKRRIPAPPHYEIVSPEKVIAALDEEYPFSRFKKYFTLTYMILDVAEGFLSHCNAGHPPPILIRSQGRLELLDTGNPLVGLGGVWSFNGERVKLERGDRLLLYTDGVIEHRNERGQFFGLDRLCQMVNKSRSRPLERALNDLLAGVLDFGGPVSPRDDVSLLGVDFKAG